MTLSLPDDARVWSGQIERWLVWLRSGGARPETVTLRSWQIRRLAAEHEGKGPWELTEDDLAAWLGGHEWAKETLRSHRSALRSFYGWAHAAGHTRVDPARLLRKVPASVPAPRPAGEQVIRPAIAKAIRYDTRAWLMLMLGSRQGLRRGEIARVHSDDLVVDLAGHSLRVQGKGGKIRTVPLLPDIAGALVALGPGWAFPGRTKAGHLTPAHVGKVMRRALAGDATSHQLRHRFATVAYRASGNIVAVSRLLGHASVATTQRYVATDADELRQAVLGAA